MWAALRMFEERKNLLVKMSREHSGTMEISARAGRLVPGAYRPYPADIELRWLRTGRTRGIRAKTDKSLSMPF